MNLNTLNYIHKMLIEHEADLAKEKKKIIEAKDEAEMNDKFDEYYALCDTYDSIWEKYKAVSSALHDFEDHNWH